jgi:FkbM family methyltransferase
MKLQTVFELENINGQIIKNTSYEVSEQVNLQNVLRDGDAVLQLGGNIGTSCMFASKHKNLSKNVCVEPSSTILGTLKKNTQGLGIDVFHGIIADTCENMSLQGAGADTSNNDWGAYVSTDGSGQSISCAPLTAVSPDTGFDVLFADCEGCLPDFINTYKEEINTKHPNLRSVIYERDGGVDYSGVDNWLSENNFKCEGDFQIKCVK